MRVFEANDKETKSAFIYDNGLKKKSLTGISTGLSWLVKHSPTNTASLKNYKI